MAVGDIYRLSCRWERAGSLDDAVNVFHFRQVNTVVFDTPGEDLVQAFSNEAVLAYSNTVNPAYTLNLFNARQVTGGAEVFEQAASVAGNDGSATNQLAAQLSGLISWRTGLAGRSKRGRTYLPPADEGNISSGLWIGDYITRMTDFVNDVIAMADSVSLFYGQWELVIWSAALSSAQLVTNGIVREVPATQRKRRLGVGS